MTIGRVVSMRCRVRQYASTRRHVESNPYALKGTVQDDNDVQCKRFIASDAPQSAVIGYADKKPHHNARAGSKGPDAARGKDFAERRRRSWLGLLRDVLSFAPMSSRRCHAPDMASLLVMVCVPFMEAVILCDSRCERRGADCDAHVPISCHHRRHATLRNEAR